MVGIMTLPRTTVGKKVIMAVTGLIWIGFLAFHMYGNLKIFIGAEYFNHYAEGLRELGKPILGHEHALWILRVIVASAFGLHVWAGITLKLRNYSSRSTKYVKNKNLHSDPAALTMIWGGLVILLFVTFHLMDLTLGTPGVNSAFVHGDAYSNVIASFSSTPKVVIYLVAVIALAFHLYHGFWSLFQTLGLNNKDWTNLYKGLAWALALIIPIGLALIPLSVMFGIVS